ncbi:hypothetical protein O7621_07590 [Solwaraspora sp. WMMD937]|uniref:hypothetical protein n=1 Tax=Solwaraspora sp. WMMD937 TaxID=3016090 RepID=UPI002499E491|nr:hypothetical protein [Solwaraspora sp. WMMD937]WFE23164.1 hypothetical protein O7621_07590 [Solwaraspora sp. WMMD937]
MTSNLLHRWPSALGLGCAVLVLVAGAGREVLAVVLGVAVLCYRNAGQCSGVQAGGEGPRWEGRRARAVP